MTNLGSVLNKRKIEKGMKAKKEYKIKEINERGKIWKYGNMEI